MAPLLAYIPEAALTGLWQSALLALVLDTVLLLVASMLLDGLRFRAAGTFLLVVVLLVTMDLAMPIVNSVLLKEMN